MSKKKQNKKSWDMGGQKSEDYHPGSNTGPIPYQMPKHPGDLPRESQRTTLDYSTLSLLEREPEEHAGVSDGASGGGAQNQAGGDPVHIENVYPEPSNRLRPFKHMPVPPNRYNEDFNSGFDTEYTQRQYGNLSLHREKFTEKVYDKATIQLSDIPVTLSDQIKKLQEQINEDILNFDMDESNWIEKGLQKNFHITVLFGVEDNVHDEVKKIFNSIDKPITIEANKIDYFDNGEDEGTVAIIKCESNDLNKLHEKLRTEIENTHRSGDYEAHVTIAYLKNGERLSNESFNPVSWNVEDLEISKSSGDIEKISALKGLNLRKVKADMNPENMAHVCAWCQSVYDEVTGEPTRQLTAEEYAAVESHGICSQCQQQFKKSSLSLKKIADDEHIARLKQNINILNDPNTSAQDIWEIAVNNNNSPTLLMLSKGHPNFQDRQFDKGRAQIQQWLDDIDKDGNRIENLENDVVGDLITPDNSDNPLDVIDESYAGVDEESQEPWQEEHQNLLNEIQAKEFPPESDTVREPMGELPQLSPQESSMLENHSADEIWDMARTGEPLAQSLINKGLIASHKRRSKQAICDWTEMDHGIAPNTRIAREIFKRITGMGMTKAADHIIQDISTSAMYYYRLNHPELKVPVPQKKKANILNSPRGVLDLAMWQDGPSKIPMLKPDIKTEIVERFFSYIHKFGGYLNPELWVKNMFYTGSTASYRYNDTSDIDIHVVVDWHDMVEVNPGKKHTDHEKVWQELHDTFWWTLNKLHLAGTKHPIQYYVVKPGEEKKIVDQKEEIYDIGHDIWLIPPCTNTEVPEKVLEEASNAANEVMTRIDQQLADTKKGLIDYVLLTELITSENAKNVYQHIAQKIREIDTNLKELKDEYASLKDKRTDAFIDQTVNSNFSLDNVIFKLVERYKYLDVLRQIKRITDDVDLSPYQIPDIADALGLAELFD